MAVARRGIFTSVAIRDDSDPFYGFYFGTAVLELRADVGFTWKHFYNIRLAGFTNSLYHSGQRGLHPSEQKFVAPLKTGTLNATIENTPALNIPYSTPSGTFENDATCFLSYNQHTGAIIEILSQYPPTFDIGPGDFSWNDDGSLLAIINGYAIPPPTPPPHPLEFAGRSGNTLVFQAGTHWQATSPYAPDFDYTQAVALDWTRDSSVNPGIFVASASEDNNIPSTKLFAFTVGGGRGPVASKSTPFFGDALAETHGIAVHPTEDYVAVFNYNGSLMEVWSYVPDSNSPQWGSRCLNSLGQVPSRSDGVIFPNGKWSPDGRWLLCSGHDSGTFEPRVIAFEFDPDTGVLSDGVLWDFPTAGGITAVNDPWEIWVDDDFIIVYTDGFAAFNYNVSGPEAWTFIDYELNHTTDYPGWLIGSGLPDDGVVVFPMSSLNSPIHQVLMGGGAMRDYYRLVEDVTDQLSITGFYGVVPTQAVLDNLQLVVDVAPGVGKSWTLTAIKNGVPTNLSVTISGTNTVASNTANSVFLQPGDTIAYHIDSVGTPAATSGWYAATMNPSENNTAIWMGRRANDPEQNAVVYSALGGGDSLPDANEAYVRLPWGLDGYIHTVRFTLSSAPGAGKSHTYDIMVNGVAQGLNLVIADSATSVSGSTNIPFVATDKLSVRDTISGLPASANLYTSVAYSPEVGSQDEWNISGHIYGPDMVANRFVSINAGYGSGGDSSTTTEKNRAVGSDTADPVMGVIMTNLYVETDVAPGPGASWVFTLRNTGVDTNIVAVVSGTNTVGQVVGETTSLANGYFDLKITSTGSPVTPEWVHFTFTAENPMPITVTQLSLSGVLPAPNTDYTGGNGPIGGGGIGSDEGDRGRGGHGRVGEGLQTVEHYHSDDYFDGDPRVNRRPVTEKDPQIYEIVEP